MCVRAFVCARLCVCMYVCVFVRACVYLCACICAYNYLLFVCTTLLQCRFSAVFDNDVNGPLLSRFPAALPNELVIMAQDTVNEAAELDRDSWK